MKTPPFLFPACCLALFAVWALAIHTPIQPLKIALHAGPGSGDDEEEDDEEDEDGGFNFIRHKLFFPDRRKVLDPVRKQRYELILNRYEG